MAEHESDENRTPENDGQPDGVRPERDLRSIMGVEVVRRAPAPADPEREATREEVTGPQTGRVEKQEAEDEVPPPYVPPVREGDEYDERRRKLEQERQEELERQQKPEPDPEFDQKMPPVWPGDEKQPWFRRERGLPPLPESKRGDGEQVDLEDLPTPLAEISTRGRALGVSTLLPVALTFMFPLVGNFVLLLVSLGNLLLYQQGQDVGAMLFRLRVVRENGDVAGFFTMFVRANAAAISLLLVGMGFLSAFSDPHRRTWHDKWLGTYVVKDAPEYRTRKRSSSDTARTWFWIILLLLIAVSLMLALSTASIPETLEGTPTPGAAEGDGPAA